MKLAILVLTLFSFGYSNGWDTTIVLNKDVTYDNVPDIIRLAVSVSEWSKPAHWSISIQSLGKTIFDYNETDSAIDSAFYDNNFVYGCNGYPKCKMKWYKEKFSNFIGKMRNGSKLGGGEYSIYTAILEEYYQEHLGKSFEQSKVLVASFKSFFKKRKIVYFSIPYSPVNYGPLMTWDIQTKTFVPWFAP